MIPTLRLTVLLATATLFAGCMKPADDVRSARWENQAASATTPAVPGY